MSLEQQFARLAEAQENSDHKIAALADAQIRTEDEVRGLDNAFVILTENCLNSLILSARTATANRELAV